MQRWVLIVLAVLAIILRLWLSATKELSFDEYFTVTLGLGIQKVQSYFNIPSHNTAEVWTQLFSHLKQWANPSQISVFLEDLNPPAYFLAMAPWMLLVPLETFWIRLPNALISLISIGLMYRLSARFISRDMAIFIACIMGFSSIHLFYGSLARPYTILIFLALLATELLLSKRWKLYSLTTLIGLLTHLFFLPILLTHSAYLLLTEENRAIILKRWSFALILPLFALTIWISTVFSLQLSDQQDNAIFTGLPLFKLLWHHSVLSRWIFYCDKPLPRWPEYSLDLIISIGIWLILLLEMYRAFIKKTGVFFQPQCRSLLILGLCWFFLPLAALTAFDVVMHSRLSGTERYLYILSPGLLMIIGSILPNYSIRIRQLALISLAILVLLNTNVFLQQRGLPTENYQGLTERILPDMKPDDLVLVMTGYPTLPALGRYLPPKTLMASVSDFSVESSEAAINSKRLTRLSKGHPTVWLIASYGQLASLQPIEVVIHILEQQGYQLTQTLDMNNIRLGGYRLSRRQ